MLERRLAGFSWAGSVVAAKSERTGTQIHRISRQFIAE
jgi:hypothetical protein